MPRKGLQELFGRDPNYRDSFGRTDRPESTPTLVIQATPQVATGASPTKAPDRPAVPEGEPSKPTRGPAVPAVKARAARGKGTSVRRTAPVEVTEPKRAVVAVNTRPLATQVERIVASGLPFKDLMKAAWRQATADLTISANYREPPAVEYAGGDAYRFSTTWNIDAEPLAALARAHDPLGVRGSWVLIRGQVEPAVWAALDDVLARIAERR